MELLKKANVRRFIKENGEHITSVEGSFYVQLEGRVKNMILMAIGNNASRRRLSQYELLGKIQRNGKESL